MTVVLDKTPSTTGTDDDTAVDTVRYASWGARAAAIALDSLPGIAVIVTMALLAYSTDSGGWLRWVFAVVLAIAGLATIVNRVLLPPLIGWTVGRAVVGIRVTASDGRAVSSIRLLGRDAAHLLDTAALFVGWLWPLWGSRNRTFADLLLRTEVRVVDAAERPTRDVRRIAALVLIAATVVCAAGTGLGYLEVYRQDRAVEQARAEIIEQGPRIVEQVLSYGTKTVTDDFARAQSLVTDDYRPQLTALQQGAQKAGIVNNEYWAVSSAVLSVSKNQAAMLLALQGQRGNGQQDLRFITATVRADFVRAGDKWQVSTLTVLKKPRSNEAAPAPGPPPAPGQPGAAPPPAPGQSAPAPGQPNGAGR